MLVLSVKINVKNVYELRFVKVNKLDLNYSGRFRTYSVNQIQTEFKNIPTVGILT